MMLLSFAIGVSFGLIAGWYLRGWAIWRVIERVDHDFADPAPIFKEPKK